MTDFSLPSERSGAALNWVDAALPDLFPAHVACAAGRLLEFHHTQQFAAGRDRALRALAALDPASSVVTSIARHTSGEPAWPEGFTGSITHTEGFVAAAVARTTRVRALGLDAQALVAEDRAARIWKRVVMPEEAEIGSDELTRSQRFSVIFSIKESVFKCVYPLVRRRFYFDALTVTDLDLTTGRFQARLRVALADEFPEGRVLTGSLALDEERAWSGLLLEHGGATE